MDKEFSNIRIVDIAKMAGVSVGTDVYKRQVFLLFFVAVRCPEDSIHRRNAIKEPEQNNGQEVTHRKGCAFPLQDQDVYKRQGLDFIKNDTR